MNWILMRWLRRTLRDNESDGTWNTMLIVQGIAMLLFFLLMGSGVLLAEAEEQVSPEWQPNQELLRKLEERRHDTR